MPKKDIPWNWIAWSGLAGVWIGGYLITRQFTEAVKAKAAADSARAVGAGDASGATLEGIGQIPMPARAAITAPGQEFPAAPSHVPPMGMGDIEVPEPYDAPTGYRPKRGLVATRSSAARPRARAARAAARRRPMAIVEDVPTSVAIRAAARGAAEAVKPDPDTAECRACRSWHPRSRFEKAMREAICEECIAQRRSMYG